jgi:hypothetical protein
MFVSILAIRPSQSAMYAVLEGRDAAGFDQFEIVVGVL